MSISNKPGASAIIWFKDDRTGKPIILVGKESVYVSDLYEISPGNEISPGKPKKNLTKDELEEYDLLNALKNTPKLYLTEDEKNLTEDEKEAKNLKTAKETFKERAEELEQSLESRFDELGIKDKRIKFDTPEKKNDGGYEVNYRYLPNNFKRGIIKGGFDSNADKNTQDTIIREIAEEVGINVPLEAPILIGRSDGYDIYCIDIKLDNYQTFIDAIKSRNDRRSGEVFDLSFKTLPDIDKQIAKYNKKSKDAIESFKNYLKNLNNSSGGKRKLKKTKKTKKNKTKKNKTKKNKTNKTKKT
jgi:hypothetical protein